MLAAATGVMDSYVVCLCCADKANCEQRRSQQRQVLWTLKKSEIGQRHNKRYCVGLYNL